MNHTHVTSILSALPRLRLLTLHYLPQLTSLQCFAVGVDSPTAWTLELLDLQYISPQSSVARRCSCTLPL